MRIYFKEVKYFLLQHNDIKTCGRGGGDVKPYTLSILALGRGGNLHIPGALLQRKTGQEVRWAQGLSGQSADEQKYPCPYGESNSGCPALTQLILCKYMVISYKRNRQIQHFIKPKLLKATGGTGKLEITSMQICHSAGLGAQQATT
jgi:hypothetical protein